jgi:hypothetical protein
MATPEEIKIRIIARDETEKAMKSAQRQMKLTADVARQLKIAFAAVSVAGIALGKSVIDSASQVESLRVRLKFMTGSTQDANKAFNAMRNYASKVPFALEEIQSASASLLTVGDGVDDLNNLLEITGDIAAVSGLSFQETAMQIQRAMSAGIASAELFRERGITAMLGFESGVSYTAEQTRQRLVSLWADGTTTMKGATNDLANTYVGQVSMMEDAWFELKLAIADAGVFEEMTEIVKELTETFKDPDTKRAVQDITSGMLELFKFAKANNKELIALFAAMWTPGGPAVKAIVGLTTLLGLAIQESQRLGMMAEDITTPGTFGDFAPVPADFIEMPELVIAVDVPQFEDDMEQVKEKAWETTAEIVDGVSKGMNDYRSGIKSVSDEIASATTRAFKTMEDALVEFTMTGKMNFKDMARSIISDLIRIQIRQSLMGMTGPGGFLGGFVGSLGSQFATAATYGTTPFSEQTTALSTWSSFAGGGYTGSGSRTGGLDGRGGFPAILHPNETVIDHNGSGGVSAPTVVNFNINAIDTQTGVQFLMTNKPAIVGMIQQAYNRRGERGPNG